MLDIYYTYIYTDHIALDLGSPVQSSGNALPGRVSPRPDRPADGFQDTKNVFLLRSGSGSSVTDSQHTKDNANKELSNSNVLYADEPIVLPDIKACILNAVAPIDGTQLSWSTIPDNNILAALQFVMVSMLVSVRYMYIHQF